MQAHVAPPAPAVEKAKPDKPAAVRGSSPDLPPTVGIPQAARYLGVSRSTAYALAASGELPCRCCGWAIATASRPRRCSNYSA